MPSTNTTTGSNTSTLNFNPAAQSVYNSLVGGAGTVLGGYINNPFGNASYNLGSAQSQAGAQQAGQNNMAALNQSALTSGLSGQAGAGFLGAQKAATGRSNQAMSSQANIQNIMAALNRQMSAAGTGLSFSPQLTGQTGGFNQNQSQTGLGTWLPQLLSSGAGAVAGAAMLGANQKPAGIQTPATNTGPSSAATASPFGAMGSSPYMAGMSGPMNLSGSSFSANPGTPNPFLTNLMYPSQ